MKGYILQVASVYSQPNISKEDVQELEHDYNWFLTNDGAKKFNELDQDNVVIQIEKNFLSLCSMMEENGSANPHKYTIVQFYGKLDYLNSQVEKNG